MRVGILISSLSLTPLTACKTTPEPVQQSWRMEYLQGFDEFYDNLSLPNGYSWATSIPEGYPKVMISGSANDTIMSATYYPDQNLVVGNRVYSCNGVSNLDADTSGHNWQRSITQVACTRLMNGPDGNREHVHGSRDVVDRIFPSVANKMTSQKLDIGAGILSWYDFEGIKLVSFVLEAAE